MTACIEQQQTAFAFVRPKGRVVCSKLTDRIRTICFFDRRRWWRDGEPLGFCAEVFR